MALTAGTSLGRYEIQAPLGAGGMGEVYLARDPLLGRTVAVKLLPTVFASDPDRLRRFEQEAQTSAALNHPRILAIHDVGKVGDQPFLVMEYVRGETLGEFLKRGRPPLARALDIGIEIANALAAAHGARIVHRDLKPANIMVTGDGHIKVLDFGLAKFLQPDTSGPTVPGAARAETSTGHVLGTPGYMSPEQLLGNRVDERTDIYTLGVILFELVTGQRPYDDIFDLLKHATPATPVRTAREVDPTVAPAVSDAIARAMAPNPDDRFDTAAELEAELQRLLLEGLAASTVAPPPHRRPAAAGRIERRSLFKYAAWLLAAMLAIGAAVPFIDWPGGGEAGPGERPVIAVLPFTYLSDDESKAYLGVGIADTLTTSLARLSSVSVVSRSNMLEAGAPTRPLDEIARDLGATLLVRGSIQQAGAVLRVNATMVTPDGSVVWSGFGETRQDGLFSTQNQLAESLLAALRIRVSAAERRNLARAPTQDTEALESYWQGLALLDRPDDADFEAAVAHFTRATALDPRFALAHAALGEAYRRRSVRTNDAELMENAFAAVSEALRHDPELPEVRLSLAAVYQSTGRNASAIEEVRRVLASQPDNDNAHRLLGEVLAREGQPKEALAAFRKAVELRPKYWLNQERLGLYFYGNSQFREAIGAFTRLAELKPNDAIPFQQLGAMHLALGEVRLARQNFERSIELKPNPGSYANLGNIEYGAGRYEAAALAYEQAVALAPTRAQYRRNLGDAYQKLSRSAEATAAYQKAIELARQALKVNATDARTVSQLAVYYAKVGSRAEAEQHSTQAVGMNPVNPEVRYHRAVVLALAGQATAAVEQLSEAIDQGYAFQLALEDDDLSSLRSLPAFQRLAAEAKPR